MGELVGRRDACRDDEPRPWHRRKQWTAKPIHWTCPETGTEYVVHANDRSTWPYPLWRYDNERLCQPDYDELRPGYAEMRRAEGDRLEALKVADRDDWFNQH